MSLLKLTVFTLLIGAAAGLAIHVITSNAARKCEQREMIYAPNIGLCVRGEKP